MSSKSYFFHLSSNDCKEIYPSNIPSSFVVDLPIPLSLFGNWEIGLTDITFDNDFIEDPKELYLCLDIIDSSYVQGALVKALQRISMPNNTSDKIINYFPFVNFMSITTNYLNSFQVKLLSENLEEATFKKGNLYCTLHLRKC